MAAKTQDAAGETGEATAFCVCHHRQSAHKAETGACGEGGCPCLRFAAPRHSPDELDAVVETVRGLHARETALAAPTGEAGVPWSSAMPFEWSDPGSPLTELRMWYDHAVLKAEAARRTGKYPLLLADKDRAFAAMLAAARVPAPSVPQEPRGESGAWAHAAVESAKQEVAEAYDAGGERARDALYKTLDLIFTRKLGRGFDPECESIACAVECALDAAALSTGGRDAD